MILGPATAKWDTSMPPANWIAVVYRYDPPGRKKEFRPWDAKRRKMTPPDPRPLYNQPGLAAAGHVVLVEGEVCAGPDRHRCGGNHGHAWRKRSRR